MEVVSQAWIWSGAGGDGDHVYVKASLWKHKSICAERSNQENTGPYRDKRVTSGLEIWVSWGRPFYHPLLLLSQKFLPLLQLSLLATLVPKQRQRGGTTWRIRTGSKIRFAWQRGKLVICRPSRHNWSAVNNYTNTAGKQGRMAILARWRKEEIRQHRSCFPGVTGNVCLCYHDNPVDLASVASGATLEWFSTETW